MPSRRRSRERRSRRRSRSRSHRRSRSRHRSSERKHKKSRTSSPDKRKEVKSTKVKSPEIKLNVPDVNMDFEKIIETGDLGVINKDLESIIKERKERVEIWQKQQKEKKVKELTEMNQRAILLQQYHAGKKWNLEDDDDDDENDVVAINYNNDEEDTLEAFMNDINKQLAPRTITVKDKGKATVIKAVKEEQKSDFGQLMEQNKDIIEYSSAEEEETLESLAIVAKKDKLPEIDHSKIYYQKVQKNFYIEIDELKKMMPTEVSKYRKSLGGIKVKGKNCPKPVKSWAHCGLSQKILTILKMHKFNQPTPIQCQAIPAIMSGRDVISVAKTGSGKTLAYLLPMIRHVKAQPICKSGDGPISVIMCPTRELAVQIYREIMKLLTNTDTRCVCIYGGTVISEQIAKLKYGAEIVVCTPGRMIDMLAANGGRVTNLRKCSFVVLDEADRMFDMGFEPQVMTILSRTRPDRQTVMFSATFPRKMEALARQVLDNPIEIEVGGKSIVCSDVSQSAFMIDEADKLAKLLELIGEHQDSGKLLIFVEKQENADKLNSSLFQHGFKCAAVHGGVNQDDRDSFIADFKIGKIPVLVATSVAARGLDVADLNMVVNYDCPNHYEDYVHRCGRTGRAGNKGLAFTFITPDQERYVGDIIRAFKLSGSTPPEELNIIYNEYKQRMKNEGKKIYTSSGFKGKGFQFDEAESQYVQEKRTFEKETMGLNDSDDEINLDDKIVDMFAVKKNVKDVEKNSLNINKSTNSVNNNAINLQTGTSDQKALNERLEFAKQLASKLDAEKFQASIMKDPKLLAAEALFGGGGGHVLMSLDVGNPIVTPSATISGKDLAAQKAQQIHSKLGYIRNVVEEEEDTEDQNGSASNTVEMITKYEELLSINDFPTNVRQRLTSKETMNNLSEYYDVGVSVRGIYMKPQLKSKLEQNGDKELHLCLESTNEMRLLSATKEITRIVKEELKKLQKAGPSIAQRRYKVV